MIYFYLVAFKIIYLQESNQHKKLDNSRHLEVRNRSSLLWNPGLDFVYFSITSVCVLKQTEELAQSTGTLT